MKLLLTASLSLILFCLPSLVSADTELSALANSTCSISNMDGVMEYKLRQKMWSVEKIVGELKPLIEKHIYLIFPYFYPKILNIFLR